MDGNLESKQTNLNFSNLDLARQLFGEHNGNLHKIAEAVDVQINARGSSASLPSSLAE